MAKDQKLVVLSVDVAAAACEVKDEELQALLADGWRIASLVGLGGPTTPSAAPAAHATFGMAVLLERDHKAASDTDKVRVSKRPWS